MNPSVVRFLLALAALLGLLLAAPAAEGASRTAIIRDCEDDSRLAGTYTAGELRDARANLPSDTDAYSDCRDVLGAALAASATRGRSGGTSAGAGGGNELEAGTGGSSGGSGSSPVAPPAPPLNVAPGVAPIAPTAPEAEVLRKARAGDPEAPSVSGVRGLAGQTATATIPTSLLSVLVLLGVTLVMAAVPYLRRRVLGRRTA